MKFPQNFFWGSAASAPQTEGAFDKKTPTTWDYWFEKEPECFYNQVGPNVTSGVYHHYKEDCRLMKEMNLNSYRTSISWARLLPDGCSVDMDAIAYYRDYFTHLRANGIEPIINLFHFDMPLWLLEIGGWENPMIVEYFSHYAEVAFENFADLVSYWTTFNEPMVHIECGYLGDAHLPRVHDFKRAIQVAYHTLMSHFAAVKMYRELGFDGKIGTILNLSPVYARSDSSEDQQAQKMADLFYIRSLLDPIVKGEFPKELVAVLKDHDLLPRQVANEAELLKQSIDFLGVNYYQPMRVQAPAEKTGVPQAPNHWFAGYDWPEKKINPHRGWEIYERGIYDIAIRMRDSYGNMPWYISENGMGVADEERFADEDGVIQDTYRIEFMESHLRYLLQAIEEGSNCFGYHTWTFVDCWSWLNAYKNRYGFYRVDLDNNLKRIPKLSSRWMAQVIANNELPHS